MIAGPRSANVRENASPEASANARFMEEAGAAIVIPDRQLDGPRLAREVAALLGAPQRTAAMAKAALSVARPDAAERVAEELLSLVNDGH